MAAQEFLDFEIEIGSSGEGLIYPVSIRSTGGEARAVLQFPFSGPELEKRLLILENILLRLRGGRRMPTPQERNVQEFGQALFDALMVKEVRSLYEVSKIQAKQQNKGLRLKLLIQSPELASVPWEFMYDASLGDYICLSRQTPLVRYIGLLQAIEPLATTPPLRILGVTASPRKLAGLDIEQEKQNVEMALENLTQSKQAQITWLECATRQNLQRILLTGKWHIFHFIGHGGFDRESDEGYIVLENEKGEADRLPATQLGRLLADKIRLVILNSCEGAQGGLVDIFSSTASILVRRGLPAVLAMQYQITDEAAISFARGFYEALAAGLPVDAAMTQARLSISLNVTGTIEWGTPVLFMRAPDGVIFRPETAVEKVQRLEREKQQREKERQEKAQVREIKAAEKARKAAEQVAQRLAAEQAVKEAADREAQRLADEKAAKEKAEQEAREKAAHEAAERETQRLAAEKAAKEAVEREAQRLADEKVAKEEAEQEARERAAREAAEREAQRLAAEKAAKEKAERDEAEKAVHEKIVNVIARFAAVKDAKEQAERQAAEREAQRLAAEEAAKEKAEQEEREQAARGAAERETQRLVDERAAKEAAEREARKKAAHEAAEREMQRLAAEKAAKETAEREAREEAERIAQNLTAKKTAGVITIILFVFAVAIGVLHPYLPSLVVPTTTISPTVTISPTMTATLPVPTISPSLAGTPLPFSPIKITSQNADRISQLARFGTGNGFPNNSVAFSPDSENLVVGSSDHTVQLWRVHDGTLLKTLEGHTDAVASVAFSPDGQIIASGSSDNTIRLWRVSDGTLLKKLEGHTDAVASVAFSPDGQILASGSNDNTIWLWHVSDGTLLKKLEGHTDAVASVAFSPDGQIIASGSYDNTIRLWRVSDGTLTKTLEGTGSNKTITKEIWTFPDGVGYIVIPIPIYSVAFSPDGKILASGSGDDAVRLWRVSDGTLLKTLAGIIDLQEEYPYYIQNLFLAFSPDGQIIAASASSDNTIRLWQVSDGTMIKKNEGFGYMSIVFSSDDRFVALGSEAGTIQLWGVTP